MVDIKRGYVGRYEERLAQQDFGAALSNSSTYVPGGYYTRCALIRTDRRLYTAVQTVFKNSIILYCVSTLGTFTTSGLC